MMAFRKTLATISRGGRCLFILAFATAAWCAAPTDDERPIYEREPYDEIRLNEANQHTVLQVEPLELPDQQLPAKRSGQLRLRLVDRPGDEYDVAWEDIEAVTFYAQLVLNEAQRLTKAGEFDDAYHALTRLLESYPKTPGLDVAVDDFLIRSAAVSYRAQKYDDALQLMLELSDRNPQRTDVNGQIDMIADRLVTAHVDADNLVAARGILETLAQRLPDAQLPRTTAKRDQLVRRAARFRDRARQRLADSQYDDALEDCRRAVAIWPSLAGVAQLAQQIDGAYPHVTVGVMLAAPDVIVSRLDDWASHRAARLVSRPVAELSGYDAEGSRYMCPYGEMQVDDSGLQFDIVLRNGVRFPDSRQMLTGYALSQQLVAMANPNGGPVQEVWSELLATASVADVFRVRLLFSRQHVRPAAFLAIPPRIVGNGQPATNPAPTGPYVIAQREADRVRYVVGSGSLGLRPPHLKQITELRFDNADAALSALRRGQIDMLDRVAPQDVARLQPDSGIGIGTYALPTVHVLLANPQRPLTSTHTLRRALCYGIHRQAILERVVLGGKPRAGCEVLSGPFPRGRSLDDPIGAAADRQVDPYPYEPRLALILAMVAVREVAAARAKKERSGPSEIAAPPATTRVLVLAFRSEPLAQTVCEAIQAHLKIVGIPVELKPLNSSQAVNPFEHADLFYTELAVWEPVVDAFRLFGEGGLAGGTSPYMNLSLDELARARNWNEARARLRAIDRIAHDELPLIPLWQTYNDFAYRQSLPDVSPNPVTLYQGVESWGKAGAVEP